MAAALPEEFEAPYTKRSQRPSPPPRVKNPLRALLADTTKKHRYDYVESMVRNIPGNFGLSVRYHLLTPFYKEAGKDVILWPGLRIKHPYNLTLKEGAQVGYDNQFQAAAGIYIGEHTIIGPGVKIWTINHQFGDLEQKIINQGYDCAPVTIEDDCWIASNAFIAPGAHLEKGCVVLPNTVVQGKRYAPNSLINGVPGTVIGRREQLKYFRKKIGGEQDA